ncbi:MAG TPA: GNAT family N-acetyltransferase [Rhodothermales bacterium]|nr:GNAT family N-acetyltransferase [Rhodothermales bacterium]
MIQEAHTSDLPRIAEIHVAAWHHAYRSILSKELLDRVTVSARLARWKRSFKEGHHTIYLLKDDHQVWGFCRICKARPLNNPPPDYGELTHLYLDPAHIATGQGHNLFMFAVDRIRQQGYAGMLLWTLERNTRARRFYEQHGMSLDGARRDEPAWLGEGVYEVRYVLPFAA